MEGTEVMGNKNTSPPKGPDTGPTLEDEAIVIDSATGKILYSSFIFYFFKSNIWMLCAHFKELVFIQLS